MKTLITILLLSVSTNILAKNILIVGDSHSAGPFGSNLFNNFAKNKENNVVAYGHASSAGLHWLGEKKYSVSGGVFQALSLEGLKFSNPHETSWRESVKVPKIDKILSEFAIHEEWKKHLTTNIQADIVVIELGANDLKAVTNDLGTPLSEYASRKRANSEIVSKVLATGAKCYWVGPPDGIHKTDKAQETLYKMLEEVTKNKCELISSRHYYVNICDGTHYSCAAGSKKAKEWADEVFKKIK